MSLKSFHIFFISLSVLLMAGFGYRGLKSFSNTGAVSSLAWGSIALGLAVALAVYLGWFIQKSKKLGS